MSKVVAIQTEPKAKNNVYYIHCLIGVVIMFGFGMITPISPLTLVGMKVLGIFISLLYLWTFVGFIWPSLIGLIALGISGYAPFRDVLLNGFGNTIPILLLFAMILFGAIHEAGVTKYISRWFLTRKIINGRPVVFSFIFIYCAFVIAALSASVVPGWLLMWSILYGLLNEVGYKKGDKYSTLMVIGVFFGSISAQAIKPFIGSALMMLGAFEQASKTTIEYAPYMLFGFIMSTLGIIIYCLLIKFVFKPDMSKIADISVDRFEKDKLPPMNLQQKILFYSIFAYIALVVLPGILPASVPGVALLNNLGAWGVVIAFVAGLVLIKINNKPILNLKEIISKHVAWDIYLFLVVMMPISSALSAKETGINGFLVNIFNPILGGHSALTFSIILLIVGVIITQVGNNAIMGMLLMPIIFSFGTELGLNIPALTTVLIFAMHYAMILPSGSPGAAMAFGNKEWLEPKQVMGYGSVVVICMTILYLVIGLPLSGVIFNMFV